MRRYDREVTPLDEIEKIIAQADVCRIALADRNTPYIVAMNFGYQKGTPGCFYFHCAKEGKKIEWIKKNNLACFQLDTAHILIKAEQACSWGMHYQSVVGMGRITIVTDASEKKRGLDCIMQHYSGIITHDYQPEQIAGVMILKLTISEMTGKKKQ